MPSEFDAYPYLTLYFFGAIYIGPSQHGPSIDYSGDYPADPNVGGAGAFLDWLLRSSSVWGPYVSADTSPNFWYSARVAYFSEGLYVREIGMVNDTGRPVAIYGIDIYNPLQTGPTTIAGRDETVSPGSQAIYAGPALPYRTSMETVVTIRVRCWTCLRLGAENIPNTWTPKMVIPGR
jgi:hypothetical protein